ncbi:hypothetical protein [Paraburkholderia kururiensis]|uniref:hypothetical protein n=1 Tax=Paraburkholderia kururiensis TaxID=984307 RepID=UPI0018F4AF9E|nr:hypothetical protein [Paraburkholderia kururiensis]
MHRELIGKQCRDLLRTPACVGEFLRARAFENDIQKGTVTIVRRPDAHTISIFHALLRGGQSAIDAIGHLISHFLARTNSTNRWKDCVDRPWKTDKGDVDISLEILPSQPRRYDVSYVNTLIDIYGLSMKRAYMRYRPLRRLIECFFALK